MVDISDYSSIKPAWCPGCGNFAILKALNRAFIELKLEPHQILLVSGIGQAGKLPHYTKGNVFNSLHGRPVPPAIGAKIANLELVVIAISGDGDGYGEGGNHFIHACRRNHDITYLVHNNQIYGLTKGQASPTSDPDFISKTTPFGGVAALNPIALAIISGATFVGRGFAGDIDHLSNLIISGISHKGFALIDILQPCPSFNRKNTFQWYKERVYKLDKEDYYNPKDKQVALLKAQEWNGKIPIGIIYKDKLPAYEEHLVALDKGSLVNKKIDSSKLNKLCSDFL